jgi:2-succinyl-6-hydroxy-2,4-cyclohexadiene-1-carboxylate synthase
VATLRSGGVEIYYELHGTRGEPVVLVHGYTGDSTDWRQQVAALAPDHRVLVMDHLGHGRSQAPSDRSLYTIERMVADVEALIDHVGFDRYHLVGHSMGGAIAQEIALAQTGRLLSLVLEDTGPDFGVMRHEGVARIFQAGFKIAEERGMAAVASFTGVRPAPHKKPERAEEERKRLSNMSVDAFVAAWGALTRWPGTRERAHEIKAPTLVIYGELDQGLIAGSRWLAETIPGARLEIVPEAGHSPQDERPDLFNAALLRHLRRNADRLGSRASTGG